MLLSLWVCLFVCVPLCRTTKKWADEIGHIFVNCKRFMDNLHFTVLVVAVSHDKNVIESMNI